MLGLSENNIVVKTLNKIGQLPPMAMLVIGVVCMSIGFLFQSDLGYDSSPIAISYSLSLGAKCEADYTQCHIRPRPVVAYRVETTRNEVVAFMPGLDGLMDKYNDCTIWSTSEWKCEDGRIAMHNGVIQHNVFETDPDVYYVPQTAWKLAKMHVLPLSSVRHAPPPPRSDPHT